MVVDSQPHIMLGTYGVIRTADQLTATDSEMSPVIVNGELSDSTTIKKGLLWQQKDKLWCRWKERYFILTRDYLVCFKKASGRFSDMGAFIFKVNLATLDSIEWDIRHGVPSVAIVVPGEGKILLRAKQGLDDWYRSLKCAREASRERRRILRLSTCQLDLDLEGGELYTFQQKQALRQSLSDSTPDVRRMMERGEDWRGVPPPTESSLRAAHRYSMMPEIDLTYENTADLQRASQVVPSIHNSSIDSASSSPPTTPSKSSTSGSDVVLRSDSFRHRRHIRPHSIMCELPTSDQSAAYRERPGCRDTRRDSSAGRLSGYFDLLGPGTRV